MNPGYVSVGSNTAAPFCWRHDKNMRFTVDMGRVQAGVGGPRPIWICDDCEDEETSEERMDAIPPPGTLRVKPTTNPATCVHGRNAQIFCPACFADQDVAKAHKALMTFYCIGCGEHLTVPGAILLSPPADSLDSTVIKDHVCVKCYRLVKNVLQGIRGHVDG